MTRKPQQYTPNLIYFLSSLPLVFFFFYLIQLFVLFYFILFFYFIVGLVSFRLACFRCFAHSTPIRTRLMELGEEGVKDALSFEQIAAQALVFFLAGFDTSSTTMSFCLYELALNPDVQERLRVEVLAVLKRNNQKLTYDSVQEMPYLDQVVAETLRKYPILPHLLRRSTKEYQIPDSNLILEPGSKIIIPVHSIHHDPELYPDPEKFDPSRFEPEEIKARHPFAYLPFGEGPRNCIGERFGKLQVKVGLVYLLRDFKFSRSEKTQIPLKFSSRNFLISTQEGVHLRMEGLERP